MFVYELVGENEDHAAYQMLAVANLARQYDFLRSLVQTSLALQRPMLGLEEIKALNYHAISCLHAHAGEIRPCAVYVTSAEGSVQYEPPAHHRVAALMAILVNDINRYWTTLDPVWLAAYVLWRLNWVHPFINGNGRTARVVAYYIICLHAEAWLPGEMLLPDLLRRDRAEYVQALRLADDALQATGQVDVSALHQLLERLLNEQLAPFVPEDEATEAIKPPAIVE